MILEELEFLPSTSSVFYLKFSYVTLDGKDSKFCLGVPQEHAPDTSFMTAFGNQHLQRRLFTAIYIKSETLGQLLLKFRIWFEHPKPHVNVSRNLKFRGINLVLELHLIKKIMGLAGLECGVFPDGAQRGEKWWHTGDLE